MFQPAVAEQVLQLALTRGLIAEEDVAVARSSAESSAVTARFGPILDQLLALGKLDESGILQLHAAVLAATTQQASTPQLGLAQTMASGPIGAPMPATVSLAGFPVPHWERYEFLELLGRGGMGAVYKARDRRLKRLVALKFIHGDDPAMVQRFMQEARAQARLDHPHICKVYEVGTVENKPYIAMELVTGPTLDRAVGQLGLDKKLRIMRDAALAVHAAHEQGIIHRDLKPGNILLERVGSDGFRPVIMDFGLARDGGSNATRGLTESGAVLGTPAYMSPEQARGDAKRLDRRSDVYSLGATLYDILVGKPPFDDQIVVNILLKVINEAPQPLRHHDPTIPPEVELIVGKCLNKEPEQRYATALALAEDIERFVSNQRITARRLSYRYRLTYWARRNRALATVAVGMLVSLLGFAGFWVRTRIVSLQKEAQAKKESELAKKLGQAVESLEWLVRTSYLLPLHDASYEKGIVRERMAAITAELDERQEGSSSLGAYALGRGHLALHEWDLAYSRLRQAEQLGYRDVELDYALGRVLGERYSRALEDARRSGDKSFFERRKAELQAEYLRPALTYLKSCHRQKTVTPTYVEGLIDFYEQRYDAAIINAHLARQQAPWLYEAAKLEGDVFLARALDQRDHGDPESAERSFKDSVNRYEQAAAIGHSDPQVYEALAEAWLRWEEMDLYGGRDPQPKLAEALRAADQALEAGPRESYGHVKKAFAYYFEAEYLQQHGSADKAKSFYLLQAENGKTGIERHPNDPYAHEVCGMAYNRLAAPSQSSQRLNRDYLAQAVPHFKEALKLNPQFPWAYNDYAVNLLLTASDQASRNQDMTASIDESLRMGRQAVALDADYLIAYTTLLTNYFIRVRFNAEHGQDPEQFVSEALDASRLAAKVNSKFLPLHLSMVTIYYYYITYKLFVGQPIGQTVNAAISEFDAMIANGHNIPPAYGYISWIDALWATQRLQKQEDPAPALAHGLAAVAACYKVAPKYPDCQAGEAQLRAVQAGWRRHQGQPFLAQLKQAHELARQASAQSPDSDDLLMVLAQLSLEVAAAGVQAGERPQVQIKEGLVAAERALEIMAGWPRALAQKGALLKLRARLESDPARRQELLRAAQSAFAEAEKGNPLLRQRILKLGEG